MHAQAFIDNGAVDDVYPNYCDKIVYKFVFGSVIYLPFYVGLHSA